MTSGLSVLGVGAHPDDIEMYCSGLLALYAEQGARTGMLVCCDGSAGIPGTNIKEAAKIRYGETLAAAGVIGAEVVWAGFPDGGLEAGLDARLKMIDHIRAFAPDVIIAHSLLDYHPDHEAAGRLVHESYALLCCDSVGSRPALTKPPVMLTMEAENGFGPTPDVYIDISGVIDKKIAMLEAHASQIGTCGIVSAAVTISRFRGLQCGAAHAEGYHVRKFVGSVVPQSFLPGLEPGRAAAGQPLSGNVNTYRSGSR